MMNSTYKVFTPAGQFDAIFAEDEDTPIEYSGDELAISFFKDWLFINQVSGEHGHLLDSQNLTPRELYGFCQPPESGIEVIPPFEDLLAYTQEDSANPVEDNDEQTQEENTMQTMITNDSAIVDDVVKNIGDVILDSLSGIEKIKLIKEAGSIRSNLQTVQSGMEKLKMVKRINEIRKILGVSSSVEYKEPNKLFDVYLEESGGDAFEAAKEFYKSELQGKIVKTVIGDVYMVRSTWREMKRGMKSDELKAKLISKVPLILSGGKYDGASEVHKERADGFVAFHFFEMDIDIDNEIVTTGVNVGERENGMYEYTAYGLGHSNLKNWQKNKGSSDTRRDEPRTDEPLKDDVSTTLDASIDQESNDINIVILKVIEKSTGERLSALEDNLGTQATIADVNAVMPLLKQFIGKSQLSAIGMGIRGEEGQFFKDKLIEVANVIRAMPKTYGQDGMGDKAIAYLHYFKGGGDWHITEKDMEDEQLQAFGLANLGYGGELGYINIQELIDAGVELDLHWTPKTIGQIKGASSEDDNQDTETGGDEAGGESTEIQQPAEITTTISPSDTIKAGFKAELETLKTETDINRFNERLDDIAGRIEQAGLMEAMDKELNDAADVLTRLLSEAEKAN